MVPTTAIIKKAQLSDTDTVWQIISSCAHDLATQGSHDWLEYYTPEIIKDKISHSTFLYYQNNQAVATVSVSPQLVAYYTPNDKTKFTCPQDPALYVSALAVLPEYQGQGIACRLLEFAQSEAKKQGCSWLRFDCNGSLLKLVRFYLNRGFRIVGMEDSEDYLLMERQIS